MSDGVEFIAVDRMRMAMRGAWRAAVGVLLGCGLLVALRGVRWREMWAADRATALGMAALAATSGAVAALVLWAAIRWLLLAGWPARLGVEFSARWVKFRLGPFGTLELDAARLRAAEAEPDEAAEGAFADEDEPARLLHPLLAGDLAGLVNRYTGASGPALAATLARYLPEVSATANGGGDLPPR